MLDDFRKKNGIMQTTLATSNPASVVVDDLPNIDTCSLAAEESYKQLRNVYYRHAHLRQIKEQLTSHQQKDILDAPDTEEASLLASLRLIHVDCQKEESLRLF